MRSMGLGLRDRPAGKLVIWKALGAVALGALLGVAVGLPWRQWANAQLLHTALQSVVSAIALTSLVPGAFEDLPLSWPGTMDETGTHAVSTSENVR
jgi:hypothetical protein